MVEARDVDTGALAGLVVPIYLTDLWAPKARAGRPFADAIRRLPLPEDGMTVNISRITTGTAVGAQALNVRTIAGMQDVSRQAVERGTVSIRS